MDSYIKQEEDPIERSLKITIFLTSKDLVIIPVKTIAKFQHAYKELAKHLEWESEG